MDKYEFSKNIIDSLINGIDKSGSNEVNNKEKILVIITSKDSLDNVILKLMKLKKEGYEILLAISNELTEKDIELIKLRLRPRKIYKEDIKQIDLINDFDFAIVPSINQNYLIKLTLGIQDDFSTRLMWNILWVERELLLDISEINSLNKSCKNDFLKNMINDYLKKLESMGVKTINSLNFKNEISKFKESNKNLNIESYEGTFSKKVITEKDIIDLKDIRRLTISKKTIITPLALDRIRDKKIEIIKK